MLIVLITEKYLESSGYIELWNVLKSLLIYPSIFSNLPWFSDLDFHKAVKQWNNVGEHYRSINISLHKDGKNIYNNDLQAS